MDIPTVLEILRPGEPWGPCSGSSATYADLARTWPGPTPVPTEAEMLATWQQIQASGGLTALQSRREQQRAKQSLAGSTPVERATRAALRVIYASLVECRQAINEVRAGRVPPHLAIRTWEQALAVVRQQIEAE